MNTDKKTILPGSPRSLNGADKMTTTDRLSVSKSAFIGVHLRFLTASFRPKEREKRALRVAGARPPRHFF
jgi:hypothetical protein